MSRSSGTIAVLIEETFVIPPCAFQCTSLIWGSDLRIPFGDVDRPELEDHLHAFLTENMGGLEKGRFLKQLSLLCLKSVDYADKGRYWEQHYYLYGQCVDSVHDCLHYFIECMY